MYPVNVRPRFADDIVVGVGEVPTLSSDMLDSENTLSGLGKFSLRKRFRKLRRKLARRIPGVPGAPNILGVPFRKKKKKKKVRRVEGRSAQAQQLFDAKLEALKRAAGDAGYPEDKLGTLLRGRGYSKAVKTLRKLAALRAKQDIAQYKESLAATSAGGTMPPAADAAASAETGLAPDTAVADSLMPATYAAQEAGLPTYAQQNVEAYAQTAQVPYQLPSGGDMMAQGQDEDVVSPMDVEGAVIDLAAQPETGIPSSALPDEDFADQSVAAADEDDIVPVSDNGSMEGAQVTPGLPRMGHAGTAKDIESLVEEQTGEEDELTLELSRGRYPAMMVEAEEIGWPSRVGEGTGARGWYGSDPAIEAPEGIEGAGSPRQMQERMRQLEAEATAKLAAGRDMDESVFIADESEAEAGTSPRERMTRMAAREATALTRYVIQKHRSGGIEGLGATPFGAQWAVQNTVKAIDSREQQLMAADPARLQAIRSLNASIYTQMEEARKILEGPSAPITDELAAVTKYTTAAASYKAALDGALKALRPVKVAAPKPAAPKTMPRAFVQQVQQRAMSPLGIAGLVAAGLGAGYLAFRAFSRK